MSLILFLQFAALIAFFGGCAVLDEMARRRAKARITAGIIQQAHDAAVAAVSREIDRAMRDALYGVDRGGVGAGPHLAVQDLRPSPYSPEDEQAFREWVKKSDEAKATSREWLRHWLSPKQREEFDNGAVIDKKGNRRWAESFWVTGSKGTRFLIFLAHNFNILQFCGCGLPWRSLCAAPDPRLNLPDYDAMALQKWHLEDDEEAVIRVANKNLCPPFAQMLMRPLALAPADEAGVVYRVYRGQRHVIGDVTS